MKQHKDVDPTQTKNRRNQEEFTDETLHIEVDPTVTKSRRIENQKRSLFQAKLNKILLWVVILLIGLIAAIIWWP